MSDTYHTTEPLIRPFKAYRPSSSLANEIVAVPYDVITRNEARDIKDTSPLSFVNISRADANFSDETDQYDEIVYQSAANSLNEFIRKGYLLSDINESFYVYRISNSTHEQTGLAFSASVEAYTQNRIKKHELTRPEKELDRVEQIKATNAITSPVMLVHRNDHKLDEMLRNFTLAPPTTRAQISDWQHEIWQIADPEDIQNISVRFNKMRSLYIADGHHRSEAACKVAEHRKSTNSDSPGDSGFLAVSFPQNSLVVLDYNRLLRSKKPLSEHMLREYLSQYFEIHKIDTPFSPKEQRTFGMYLKSGWYRLCLRTIEQSGIIENLDVTLLQNLVLEPFFDIKDPRTDDNISFVGGTKGTAGISNAIDRGEADVGFTLAPTQLEDLIAIADQNLIMPPKSTWFEPKLADGLLCMLLDEASAQK